MPATWGFQRRPPWRTSVTPSSWPSASRSRLVDLASRVACPSSRRGWTSWWRAGVASGLLAFTDSAVDRGHRRRVRLLVCAHPTERTGRPTCPTSRSTAKEIGSHLEPGAVVVNKSTVPVGSATMVEQVIGRSDISVVSNPEFLPRGHGRPRQPPSRPHRRRSRQPPVCRPGRRPLRIDGGPAHRHGRHHVGDDQVRIERLLGDQAELRERAGRSVRGSGRRRPRRPARPGLRQTHRVRVPSPRPRMGRFVPAQGHAGPPPHRVRGRI